jgi:hypothetical protein
VIADHIYIEENVWVRQGNSCFIHNYV